MSQTIRSFVAFDIDSDGILNRLSEVQEKLTRSGADLKLVNLKNIHITMRFLGDIRQDIVDKIHDEMKQIRFTEFETEIRGLGVFPTNKYARVVWAGIQKGAERLRNIFEELEPRLRNLGFKPDAKGFTPHITIARVRTGRNRAELIRCISELENFDFGILKTRCLKLKKSVLTPQGPVYSTLKQVCGEN